jgi:hypothetical protein
MSLNNLPITEYRVDLMNLSKRYCGKMKNVTITFQRNSGLKEREKSFGFTTKKQQSMIPIRKSRNELKQTFNQ